MGHITLAVPVVHLWYLRSIPSKISNLLGYTTKQLESITYYENYVVLNPAKAPDKYGELIDEDKRQIGRWRRLAGKKGRFKTRLINMIKARGAKFDDAKISPVIRQLLQHWGYRLTQKDLL